MSFCSRFFLLYSPSLLQCRRKRSPASRQDKTRSCTFMLLRLFHFFSLPPSCFLPGLKVDVEKLEQNIPCCKASDALASIILWGGVGAAMPGGFWGFHFFFPWSCRHGEPHTKSTHTCTAHFAHTQKQLWEHGANSSGTEATKSRGFIVEIYFLSLHGAFLFFFSSCWQAGRPVFFRIPSPKRKMAKMEFGF